MQQFEENKIVKQKRINAFSVYYLCNQLHTTLTYAWRFLVFGGGLLQMLNLHQLYFPQ